jgi:hypothetical protein
MVLAGLFYVTGRCSVQLFRVFVVGVSHDNEALDRRIEIPAKGGASLKPQIVGIDNDAQNIQTAGRPRLVVLPCVGPSDAVRVDVESNGAFERPS